MKVPFSHRITQPTNAMPSLSQDDNKEQLSTTSGEAHAAATMTEDGGDGNTHHSSVALSKDDVCEFSSPDVTNVNNKSTVDGIDETNVKSDEELSDREAKEAEVETRGARRATTKRSSSTNEKNDILSSKALSTKPDNGTVEKGHGVDATVDDYLVEENGESHDHDACALATGKSNESAFQVVETENDNHHRQQHNHLFLTSLTQSNGTFTRSSRNEKQDEYVKKGARVKAMLASALQAVADGLATRAGNSTTADRNGDNEDEVDAEGKSKKAHADFGHVQDLAQKKSEECITLKRVSSCSYGLSVVILAFQLHSLHS